MSKTPRTDALKAKEFTCDGQWIRLCSSVESELELVKASEAEQRWLKECAIRKVKECQAEKTTDNLVNELAKKVRECAPTGAVSFRLFVTHEGIAHEFECKDAGALKRSGISMRDMRGNFIE